MSTLANRMNKAKAPAATSTLGTRRAAISRGEAVVLPLLGPAYIQLNPRHITDEIESQVMQKMAELQLEVIPLNARTIELQRTARTLAAAVRNPDNHAEPFGPVEEWLELDDDLVNACGFVHMDVRERLDPIGAAALTEQEFDAIRRAFEKKDPRQLSAFGVSMLAIWLATSGLQLPSSPIPTSSTGPA